MSLGFSDQPNRLFNVRTRSTKGFTSLLRVSPSQQNDGANLSIKKTAKLCHAERPPEEEEEEEEEEHDDKKPFILPLPHNLIVEIFCKIPTKTLIQCRYVCKSWHRLMSDPQFTKDLYSRTPSCHLIQSKGKSEDVNDYFLLDLDRDDNAVFKLPLNLRAQYFTSCNGFLFLYNYDATLRTNTFYIVNPITGESLALPRRARPTERYRYVEAQGFGCSLISKLYKVVLQIKPFQVMVMTVGCGIWRSIGDYKYRLGGRWHNQDRSGFGIYLNGCLHWMVDTRLICVFDLERESFLELSPPPFMVMRDDKTNHHPGDLKSAMSYQLGILKGRLCITVRFYKDIHVWVMKDYGIEESWTKEIEMKWYDKWELSAFSVEVITEGGKFLLGLRVCGSDEVYIFTPGREGMGIVRKAGMGTVKNTNSYVPSFVSLKDAINLNPKKKQKNKKQKDKKKKTKKGYHQG